MDANPRGLRSKRVQAIEKRYHKPLSDVLRKLYWEDGLNQAEVAQKLGVPPGTVGGWMVRFGLDRVSVEARLAAKELAS